MKIVQLVFFMLACHTLFAQVDNNTENKTYPKFEYGPSIGVNLSIIPEFLNNVKNNTPRLGLNAGVFMRCFLNEKLFLQPEISYSQQGTDVEFEVETELLGSAQLLNFNGDFELNYIHIPFHVRYAVLNNFYLGGGPYISLLTKKSVRLYTNDNSVSIEGDFDEVVAAVQNIGVDVDFKAKNIDYGFSIDLAYQFNFGVALVSRVGIGLQNLIENTSNNEKLTSKNYLISLKAEYAF